MCLSFGVHIFNVLVRRTMRSVLLLVKNASQNFLLSINSIEAQKNIGVYFEVYTCINSTKLNKFIYIHILLLLTL